MYHVFRSPFLPMAKPMNTQCWPLNGFSYHHDYLLGFQSRQTPLGFEDRFLQSWQTFSLNPWQVSKRSRMAELTPLENYYQTSLDSTANWWIPFWCHQRQATLVSGNNSAISMLSSTNHRRLHSFHRSVRTFTGVINHPSGSAADQRETTNQRGRSTLTFGSKNATSSAASHTSHLW